MLSSLTFGHVLAALTLLACLAVAGHMLLSPGKQKRVNAGLHQLMLRLRRRVEKLSKAQASRRHESAAKTAAEATEAAIRRAKLKSDTQAKPRPEGSWDGNVYRPRSFQEQQGKKDKGHLH